METKNNNAFLSVLLIIFIISTFTLGGYIFYDKVIVPNHNTKEQNSNTINQNNQNNNFVSKVNSSKNWIYEAEYEKNISANSYTTYYDKTYYAKDIVVPYININTDDAIITNNELKQVFTNAVNTYNQGVENKTDYVEMDYNTYINDNLASVVLWYGKGETDTVKPTYYTYNFDLKTGKTLTFEELYQSLGFTKNQITNKITEEITEKVTDILEDTFPNTNNTEYINKSINNYEESLTTNALQYFVAEDGNLSIIVKISIPAGTGYQNTIVEID